MMGKSKASKSAKELFAKNRGINLLAAARVVLFGARDVWFVVGVPVFLYARAGPSPWWAASGAVDHRLRPGAGLAPHIVRRSDDGLSPRCRPRACGRRCWPWCPCAGGAGGMKVPHLEWVVVAGLGLFGVAFAVNSSVHSYLVLAYAGSEKAAEDVGFYYAANALGRFFGTLLSGLLYQWGGLLYALIGSAVMLTVCWLVTLA
jgi:hypothetical protein